MRNMRQFYITFPNRNAVRTELSWMHYRTLLKLENPLARESYLNETLQQSWSAVPLDEIWLFSSS
ncbi:DUF1016 N-terminal domain-containing protein [Thiomicrospira microaerophila]|uniref:DUF1016 N-terminal domain-containing protein n=1 Tax=Thiomicrospira microaerophila TaxID=406020 RepID=UPI003899E704